MNQIIKYYGQRDIPKFTIRTYSNIYNDICDYYQDYYVIHKNGKKSKWVINLAVIPEGFREDLNNVKCVTLEEIHRSVETGEDTTHNYEIVNPIVSIKETQDCCDDGPINYQMIIRGYLR